MVSEQPQLVKVKLLQDRWAEENCHNIVANVVVIHAPSTVRFVDEATDVSLSNKPTQMDDEKPEEKINDLHYFAVGPGTYLIKCPLCKQAGNAAVLNTTRALLAGICCWHSPKDIHCNKCGGKLGQV